MLRKIIAFFFQSNAGRGQVIRNVTSSPIATEGSKRESLAVAANHSRSQPKEKATILKGRCFVIDGDTIVINKTHVRLAGIDAPELDQPFGQKSKSAMIALCRGKIVTATCPGETSYGRVVGKCELDDGTDLSAALVEQGLALDWARYSGGSYRHLEPDDARKKLWRVRAKHEGWLKDRMDD